MGSACLSKNYIDETAKMQNIYNINTNNLLSDDNIFGLITNEEESRNKFSKINDAGIENQIKLKEKKNKIENIKQNEKNVNRKIKTKKNNQPKSTSNLISLKFNMDDHIVSKNTLKTNSSKEGPIISLLKQKYNSRKNSENN